jgi:transposase
MMHSGIDSHKNDLVITTLDSAGTALKKQRLRTHAPVVAQYFRSLPRPHRAVVESTSSGYWLADLLQAEGVELTLAHSKLVKAIAYAKVKTDAVDAHTLAQLLRVDLIPRAHMISPELRAVRDVLRVRLRLGQKRTRCQSAIGAVFTKYSVREFEELPELAQLEVECHQLRISVNLTSQFG